MKTHPALREQFAWLDNMKRLLADPVLDTLAKRWKRERELMARAVDSLKLKDPTR
jgi:hypothetical protein